MKKRKLFLNAAFLIVSGLSGLQGQEALPASGGNISEEGGSVSYTVGQVVYNTNTGTNGSVAEGVQQPYEISVVTGIKEAKGISLTCSVYPNPASEFLKLKIDNYSGNTLSYQLYDLSGKLLENKNISNNETRISMGHLVPSTYFLKVIDHGKEIKSFKIIKN